MMGFSGLSLKALRRWAITCDVLPISSKILATCIRNDTLLGNFLITLPRTLLTFFGSVLPLGFFNAPTISNALERVRIVPFFVRRLTGLFLADFLVCLS